MQIPSDLKYWVLAGQSNMQGIGLMRDVLPSDDRVLCFTMAGNWEVARDPLHKLWESFTPVHQDLMRGGDQSAPSDEERARLEDETRLTGGGLGLVSDREMADALGKPIGLISAAHGGTLLDQWDFRLKDQRGKSLYGGMIERIERAGGDLNGVLWYQGESDATPEFAKTYERRFEEWVQALRSDVGKADLPVIVVQLGRFILPDNEIAPWWDMVREAERTLPEKVPNTAVAAAIDLPLDDLIHISSQGHVRLGRRMARLALNLLGNKEIPTGPQIVSVEKADLRPDMGAIKVKCEGVTGRLHPATHMGGFELRTADNKPHPENRVVDARVPADDPSSIHVLLTLPLDGNTKLAYGLGLDPYCNVVNDADMALCCYQGLAIA